MAKNRGPRAPGQVPPASSSSASNLTTQDPEQIAERLLRRQEGVGLTYSRTASSQPSRRRRTISGVPVQQDPRQTRDQPAPGPVKNAAEQLPRGEIAPQPRDFQRARQVPLSSSVQTSSATAPSHQLPIQAQPGRPVTEENIQGRPVRGASVQGSEVFQTKEHLEAEELLQSIINGHLAQVRQQGSVSDAELKERIQRAIAPSGNQPASAALPEDDISLEQESKSFLGSDQSTLKPRKTGNIARDQSGSSEETITLASFRRGFQWETEPLPGFDALDTDEQELLLDNLRIQHTKSNEFYIKALYAVTSIALVFFVFNIINSPTLLDLCCIASIALSFFALPVASTAEGALIHPGERKLKMQRLNLLFGIAIVIITFSRSWLGIDSLPILMWDGRYKEYYSLLPIMVSAMGYFGRKIMEGINFNDLESKKYHHKTV